MSRLLFLFALGCAPAAPIDAPELARRTSDGDFVVPEHPVVFERLDAFLTHRQAFLEAALARRDEVAFIEGALESRGLPSELLAVALVESGFQDIAARPPEFPGGGVWQFIPSTARHYGLVVDDRVDERRDLARSTDAALSLLSDLHSEFGDWGLAFAAYNQGPSAVHRAMSEHDAEEVWPLIEVGALNPYAADVMAAAVVVEQAQALGLR